MCRKLSNHKTLHFRPFLAKNSWLNLLQNSKKPYFCPFLGPFCPKSREREFSQIWDLCRKLANHKALHFRTFLAKTNDSILSTKVQKPNFCPFLGPFCPKSREREFSQTWDLCRKLANHNTLHFKNYKKRLNGSKDIVIWKIERSDWSRAFINKSWEWQFSQI